MKKYLLVILACQIGMIAIFLSACDTSSYFKDSPSDKPCPKRNKTGVAVVRPDPKPNPKLDKQFARYGKPLAKKITIPSEHIKAIDLYVLNSSIAPAVGRFDNDRVKSFALGQTKDLKDFPCSNPTFPLPFEGYFSVQPEIYDKIIHQINASKSIFREDDYADYRLLIEIKYQDGNMIWLAINNEPWKGKYLSGDIGTSNIGTSKGEKIHIFVKYDDMNQLIHMIEPNLPYLFDL